MSLRPGARFASRVLGRALRQTKRIKWCRRRACNVPIADIARVAAMPSQVLPAAEDGVTSASSRKQAIGSTTQPYAPHTPDYPGPRGENFVCSSAPSATLPFVGLRQGTPERDSAACGAAPRAFLAIIVFEARAISGRRLRQAFSQSNSDQNSQRRATRHAV